MLQLALAALLAGSLITGSPDGDKDKDKDKAKAQQPIESIIVPAEGVVEDDPILDTYSLGRTERIPIKLWLGYSQAKDDEFYDATGEEQALLGINEINVRRAFVGAQINVCSPAAMCGHPCTCGGVGSGNEDANQARTAGENASSTW